MKLSRVNKHNLPVRQAGRNKGGLWIALILLFVSFANAQSEFPINDPRNPQCPCHKYQKQAEEEYKQLLAQNNSVSNNKEIKLNDDQKFGGISNDAMGNTHHNSLGILPGNTHLNNFPKFGGISADDLARINNSKGENVLGLINDEPGDLKVSEQKTVRSGSNYVEKRHSTAKHWKGKRKKHTAFHKQMKRIFYVGGWDIWKRKRVTAACYHWK